MDSFPPYNQIPNPNTRLNRLLIVLIFTFLLSGGVLVILKQIDSYHREQIYLATQATLPVHKSNSDKAIADCLVLPAEILQNKTYKDWATKNKIAGEFCGNKAENLKLNLPGETVYKSAAECKKAFGDYPGKLISNSSGARSVCMGTFGEPDSYAVLFSKNKEEQGRLRFCGTVCGFNDGAWLDNNRFMLLESSVDAPHNTVELFDFEQKIQQKWELNNIITQLKTYKNENLGFEFEYPTFQNIEEKNGMVVTTFPAEVIETGVNDSLFLEISFDNSKKYKDLAQFLGQWDYKDSAKAGLWNVEEIGYKTINGIKFYNYTWTHQGQGEVYLAVYNSGLLKITLSSRETQKPLGSYKNYPAAKKIIETFKSVEKTDTSTWQTYRNEEMGFEVKYPSSFQLGQQTNDYVEIRVAEGGFNIQYRNFYDSSLGRNWTAQELLNANVRDSNLEKGEIILDGVSALRVSFCYGQYPITRIVAKKPGDSKIFSFDIEPAGEETTSCRSGGGPVFSEFKKSVLNQMLLTFKFIEKSDASTWKTYRNEKYGFELKYPQELKLISEIRNAFPQIFFEKLKGKDSMQVQIKPISLSDWESYAYMDIPHNKEGFLGGARAKIWEIMGSGCEADEICEAIGSQVAYSANHEDQTYNLIFYGDASLSPEEQKILSSFKFTK